MNSEMNVVHVVLSRLRNNARRVLRKLKEASGTTIKKTDDFEVITDDGQTVIRRPTKTKTAK
jgi:hypothetical protein